MFRGLWIAAVATVLACAAPAGQSKKQQPIKLSGSILEPDDLSAAVLLADGRLVLAADEGSAIQIFAPTPDGSFRLAGPPVPLFDSEDEADFESLSSRGEVVHVVGSHSLQRKKLRDEDSRRKTFNRLHTVNRSPLRDQLHRFRITADSNTISHREQISLLSLLADDEILGPFTGIPHGENGVDIEAIADDGKRLFIGFRSPVLRSGLVPVMILDFDKPTDYELRFVDLGERGIRGLTRVSGGFLILAGAESGKRRFRLYFWDGTDRIPGSDVALGKLKMVKELSRSSGVDPESVALVEETDSFWDVIVVRDGVVGGEPSLVRVMKH